MVQEQLQEFRAWFEGEEVNAIVATFYAAKDAAESFASLNVPAFEHEEVRRVLVQGADGVIHEYEVEIEISFSTRRVKPVGPVAAAEQNELSHVHGAGNCQPGEAK